jgi:hypothetical protein
MSNEEIDEPVTTHSVDYSMYIMNERGWSWVGITSAENAVAAAAQVQGVNGNRAVKVERVQKTEVRSTFVYLAKRGES